MYKDAPDWFLITVEATQMSERSCLADCDVLIPAVSRRLGFCRASEKMQLTILKTSPRALFGDRVYQDNRH